MATSVVLLVLAKSVKTFCLVIHALMMCKMSKSSFCEPFKWHYGANCDE